MDPPKGRESPRPTAMPVPPPPITAAPAGAHRHDGLPWDAHFTPSERTKEVSPAPPKQVLHPRTPQAEHEEAARFEAARVEAQRQERQRLERERQEAKAEKMKQKETEKACWTR